MLRDLREGWSEFRYTWLWVVVAQFGVILMAWYGSFEFLGPCGRPRPPRRGGRLPRDHRLGVDRPDRRRAGLAQVHAATAHAVRVVIGGAIALSPVSLAGPWPLPLGLPGVAGSRHHDGDHDGPVDRRACPEHPAAHPGPGLVLRRARVRHGHAGGGARGLPIASVIGLSATQYGAAGADNRRRPPALILRDIRQMRAVPPTARPASPGPRPATVMAARFRTMSRPWTTGPGPPHPAAHNRCPHPPAALPAGVRAENPSVAGPCAAGPAARRPRQIDRLNAEMTPLRPASSCGSHPASPGRRALRKAHYGIGGLLSVAVWAELGDCRWFASSDDAVRFTGLDITVYASDGKRARGHIARQGSPVLRWALYEAALDASRPTSPDYAYFCRVRQRIDGQRALLSVAASSPAAATTPCATLAGRPCSQPPDHGPAHPAIRYAAAAPIHLMTCGWLPKPCRLPARDHAGRTADQD